MTTTFRDLIADNKRKSVLLVVIFILFTAAVAMVLSLAVMFYFDQNAVLSVNLTRSFIVGGIAMGISVLLSIGSYYQGDKMVLATSGAQPIEHKDDPQLYNVVEEMAIAAGVPMPRVYLISDPAPNAFATGRDPEHASIAITTGLREKLNREELQGVVAHEMSHIRNFDIRLMLLMAVLIGTIVMLSDVFWQILRFGGGGSRSSSNKDSGKGGGGGVVMLVIFVIAIVLAILAPILAQIIQLAVSRQREYLADATGVQLTRNPLGLANALRKIEADPNDLKAANRGTAHLFIANPIKKFEARADSIFASHPPIEDRIARLEALVGQKPQTV
jgi:heat shock protein HtpX